MTDQTVPPAVEDDLPDKPIHHLHRVAVSNIKGVRGATVDVDSEALIVVSGENGQGKSSFVDAIWYALLGGKALKGTAHPVTRGEENGQVELTFVVGDGPEQLLVTKRWSKGGGASTLEVRNNDGFTVKSPQAVLDGMLGPRALDPLAFMRLSPTEQVRDLVTLLGPAVEENLAQLDQREAEAYEARTDVGREVKALRARVDAIPEDPDAPLEPVSITELLAQLHAAQAQNDGRERRIRDAEQALNAFGAASRKVDELAAAVAAAEEELAVAKDLLDAAQADVDDLPDSVALDPIRERMEAIEEVNERARARKARSDLQLELTVVERRHRDLDAQVDAVQKAREQVLAASDMPIDGLSFGSKDVGLVYNDVALKDCSAAEQRLVACALAMSGDPQIRLVSIEDGSLLDEAAQATLAQLAYDRDFHVLLEVVGAREGSIVFSEGRVVS